MIVFDSSALLAILQDEPEKDAFANALSKSDQCLISAVNAHEAAIVMRRRYGPAGRDRVWALIVAAEIEVIAFDEAQARAAGDAFDRFGKGIDPKARLNLSDCAAYALAKAFNAPLLFKGDDFVHTDVASA